jgi:hypothetical protein
LLVVVEGPFEESVSFIAETGMSKLPNSAYIDNRRQAERMFPGIERPMVVLVEDGRVVRAYTIGSAAQLTAAIQDRWEAGPRVDTQRAFAAGGGHQDE